jgi:tRNA(Leu) C34 or U34 (ribose-2'-O)-methylase TrmL
MREDVPQFKAGDPKKVRKEDILYHADRTPAIIMHNPKYAHNVGAAVRACSCFGSDLIIWSGDRVPHPDNQRSIDKKYRLPREERMKGYSHVELVNDEYPFNRFGKNVTPVAVEVRDNSEVLPHFIHPENPVYVFGPEDGSIPQIYLKHCQRFLVIPSLFCTNLAAAVYIVLYDRMAKIMRGEVTYAKEANWI